MKIHTTRTLYDKWNDSHETKRIRIKELKEKRVDCINEGELSRIERELEELFIEVNLIHHLLADLGLMVYKEETKII